MHWTRAAVIACPREGNSFAIAHFGTERERRDYRCRALRGTDHYSKAFCIDFSGRKYYLGREGKTGQLGKFSGLLIAPGGDAKQP
jgi:hypothetical protein